MKENELIWNQTLKTRNELQQKCLNNGHSYTEEIKISVPDGVTIETVIGGMVNGNINWTMIYPGDDIFAKISEHMNTTKELYERNSNNIIKDKP
jgi:hypothetical protein